MSAPRTIAWLLLSAAVLVTPSAPAVASAAAHTQITILLVATYHFGNPGQDAHNVEAVDMLAPSRQREIEAIAQSLARFGPTRVAVEWPANIVDERYSKYLAGTLPESRNEVVQLGFRLARLRSLKHVDGIDVDGAFPFEAVDTWAKAHGREAEIEQLMAAGEAETNRISALQHQTSIAGVLRYVNSAQAIERNHSFYPPLLTMGAGEDQPGVALLSAWQTRNLAICARLLQSVRTGDRVVVFYGQGHIHLLQQCLGEQANVSLVDATEFLN